MPTHAQMLKTRRRKQKAKKRLARLAKRAEKLGRHNVSPEAQGPAQRPAQH